ncbi:uncharacterized protein LTR77_009100 [Saxophila tyrrhenica]|uniref:Chitin-binding type-1 domain-containing protein n=1 Tax=Saxophila tyrrhenica TaxID=1690608 RepID=A0AAV9P2G1_9PEZI|nr:hypothetical protein LTR77_009100 [Saxophila tyrrhenica]
MHSFTTLTLATACFTALTGAVPMARNKHHRFHGKHGGPPAGLEMPTTYNLSPIGQCGGDTGYGCGPGFCCSQYGYCGTTEEYCGNGGSENSTAPAAPPAGPPSYPSPSGGWGASSAAPASSSEAPAPSGYSAPSSAPAAPSSAAPAPSTYAPVPPASSPAESAPASSAAPAPSTYAAPSPSASSSPPSNGGGFSGYKMYTGNGSPSAGWPSEDSWMDFESAWSASLPNMQASCAQWNVPNNTPQEISEIKSAILSAAKQYGVDERFVLAVMMQESNGCVRVHTTNNGVVNPGLFQSHDGSGSCNNGQVMNPCPQSQIQQMVNDGVGGTPAGDGLKQTMAQTGNTGCQAYFGAAVIYNSGNLPENLDDNTATPCYASDVANRLMGWTSGASECTL